MKKNTIITIGLSFCMIVGGAFILYGSMTSVQGKTITKTVEADMTNMELVKENQQSLVDTEVAKNSTETDHENLLTTEDDFIIEFDQEQSSLKKEAVDMDMEDAFRIVLKQIEKTYSVSLAGKKVIMTIDQYSNDEPIDRLKGARYYKGFIICDSESGYSFTVNSVTGEIYSIGKLYQDIDKDISIDSEETLKQMGIIHDMYTKLDLETVQDIYYDIAEAYIVNNLDEVKVVKKYGICPGDYGTNYVDVPHMYVMSLYCVIDNGGVINILIDQVTKEVVDFHICK